MRSFCLAFVLVAACSPYSPNLGKTPFLCGMSDPKCPDGYSCQTIGMQQVCVQNGATPPDAPNPNSMCADDSQVEMQNGPNNDSIQTAYQTPVATSRKDLDFTNLAICPSGDKDYYSVQLTAVQNIDVTVIYDTWGAVLQGEVDNSGGSRIGVLGPSGADRTLHVYVANLPSDQYYVLVEGPSSTTGETRNNYELKIVVTP
jgi:hypothetical protein